MFPGTSRVLWINVGVIVSNALKEQSRIQVTCFWPALQIFLALQIGIEVIYFYAIYLTLDEL